MYANRYCFPLTHIRFLLQVTRAIVIMVMLIGLAASVMPRSHTSSGVGAYSSLTRSERTPAPGHLDRFAQLSSDATGRTVPLNYRKQVRPQMDRDLDEGQVHDFVCCLYAGFQAPIAGTQPVILDFAYRSALIVPKIAPPI